MADISSVHLYCTSALLLLRRRLVKQACSVPRLDSALCVNRGAG